MSTTEQYPAQHQQPNQYQYPPQAQPQYAPTAPPPPQREPRRDRRATKIAAVAAGLILLAGGAAVGTHLATRGDEPATTANSQPVPEGWQSDTVSLGDGDDT
ncbi:MAG: hypothetical protein LBK42_05745 [Propionibacteriaceae bacterium]|nr:hypothetical protein [Propionibacteriaceae bacterium]